MVKRLRRNLTRQEARLWLRLREFRAQGLHFRKQVPIDRYVVDFACLSRRLLVEIDGEQHGWDDGQRRDAVRDRRLGELGYRVLRFSNHDVNRSIDMVVDTIFARASEGPTRPALRAVHPPLQGRDERSAALCSSSHAGEGGRGEAAEPWGLHSWETRT